MAKAKKPKKVEKHILSELDEVPVRKVSWAYRFVKRSFDLITSLLIILLISWFLIIIAILVSISSHGTPFYLDPRIGYKQKEIKVVKFRSMFVDANDRPEKYLNKKQLEQFMVERKVDNDPRITKIGHFIRKTSIDELPQLFNIFIGNMSFVGPRPITVSEFDICFSDKQKAMYCLARPGLTGVWQVSGRSNVTFMTGERQKLELSYLAHRSLWFDFKILIKTPLAVLKHKGAK